MSNANGRMREAVESDMAAPRQYWWLSFADGNLPTGEQNLGCTVVVAGGLAEAAAVAHALGINPGGEVAGCGFDLGEAPLGIVEFMLNKLRSKAEIEAHEVPRTED